MSQSNTPFCFTDWTKAPAQRGLFRFEARFASPRKLSLSALWQIPGSVTGGRYFSAYSEQF
jgi:hypothetical protein